MKQYFVRVDRWYYPKNKLEEAIITLVRQEFDRVLMTEDDLKGFRDDLSFQINLLNKGHFRAKPLSVNEWQSNDYLCIRRDVKEGIDDLLMLQAVEVSRVFGKEVRDANLH